MADLDELLSEGLISPRALQRLNTIYAPNSDPLAPSSQESVGADLGNLSWPKPLFASGDNLALKNPMLYPMLRGANVAAGLLANNLDFYHRYIGGPLDEARRIESGHPEGTQTQATADALHRFFNGGSGDPEQDEADRKAVAGAGASMANWVATPGLGRAALLPPGEANLGVVRQYPFIEGPALPRPTYWPPLRRSAPRSPVDRSPSADPRTVDVNQPRETAPQPSSPTPNAQTADQSARSILIPSERNPVTGTDEEPVGRRPFSGKDVQPDSGGSDFQDPQSLDAWLAHAANLVRGRDDGGATGAPAPARLGAARFEAPTSEASRPWYGADFDEVPREPPPKLGEKSPESLSPENAQFLRDYLGLQPQDFDGTVRNINGRIWVSGDLLRDGEIVGQIGRSAKAETATAVHHNIELRPDLRGSGLSKHILAANIGYYRSNGINRVRTRAGDEDGGLTWARYGFVPEAKSWADLQGTLIGRLNQIEGLPDRQYNRIKELLLSPDPKAIWGIADNQTRVPDRKNSTQVTTLGKRLLRGSHWKGYMDLNDNEINNRFDEYVKNRPEW
jgi:GNAT superfamily N-acetyltransferase